MISCIGLARPLLARRAAALSAGHRLVTRTSENLYGQKTVATVRNLTLSKPLIKPPSSHFKPQVSSWGTTPPLLARQQRDHGRLPSTASGSFLFGVRLLSSTTYHQQSPRNSKRVKRGPPLVPGAFVVACVFAGLFWYMVPKPLNEQTFVPFTITAREQVSPTSFIITVEHKDGDLWGSSRKVMDAAWAHGLFCVEIKQPELQVARDYTPLPPPPIRGEDAGGKRAKEEHQRHGNLRFLIRKMDGGEVSTYLSRLKVGDQIELRGPHLGFDLKERLGEANSLVFLAGGTGVAPALQAIHKLLDGHGGDDDDNSQSKPFIHLMWANRRREDCDNSSINNNHNAIVSLLKAAKARHGDRFNYTCTVDAEGSFITDRAVSDAVTALGGRTSLPASVSENCQFHSPVLLAASSERDDKEKKAAGAKCECGPSGGKNLLMVSGPDGFIEHFVGPKRWYGGKELQGPVRGVVGDLTRKKPKTWDDWLVLKL